MKQLWVLTGGNGAGKSTFYRTRLKPLGLPFINADVIARELFPNEVETRSYDAARMAEIVRNSYLEQGRSFCFETVFSHPSKIDFVARAKALGYEIIVVYIHLANDSLNRARVAQRVSEGGHNVPDEKVKARIPRSLQNAIKVVPLCDQFRVLNNSRFDDPFQSVITIKQGKVVARMDELPEWAQPFTEGMVYS